MDPYDHFPQKSITPVGPISRQFVELSIATFHDAVQFVHALPYGYNSDRNDPFILFKEKMGSCTTKHGVIATLAAELDLEVFKVIGIYKLTENIAGGVQAIQDKYRLPYIPLVHCFLTHEGYRFDLTEGNHNGKNAPIESFIQTKQVMPFISDKEEYLWYRQVLQSIVLLFPEMKGKTEKHLLKAREEAIALLKAEVA